MHYSVSNVISVTATLTALLHSDMSEVTISPRMKGEHEIKLNWSSIGYSGCTEHSLGT